MASSVRPVVTVICLVLLSVVQSDKFTALKDLENILIAEHGIANDLKAYIYNEEIRLEQLKKLAKDFEEHSAEALENPERHLGNPVNAFLLVKRFTQDWDNILNTLIKSDTADRFLANVSQKAEFFPDDEDLGGAAQALLRLQDTYQLETKKIATGDLQGVKKSPVLSAADSFELAKVAYNNNDHYHSVLWMAEALDRLEKENPKTADRALLLDYLSFSTYMQGNPRKALNLTLDWLTLEPEHSRAQNNKKYYEQMIAEEEAERRRKGDDGPFPQDNEFKNTRIYDEYRASEEFASYEALCRGEDTQVYPLKHKLSCQFRRHHPIYYIRPLREEIMYFDPFIAVYHDLITNDEVAKVKELASPRLNRAIVQNPLTGQMETANYRISKSAWLKDEEHPLIKSISTKSASLASLTLDTVEELQVVNYGIGGHYEPHYDFARGNIIILRQPATGKLHYEKREKQTFEEWRGNRIATVIYYMTDVDAGGYTVFPQIGVKLPPIKGSCALWYNLRKNGEGNYDTRHAGCPVLTGTKWVCNKWFHERGQEFVRPCSLNPEE